MLTAGWIIIGIVGIIVLYIIIVFNSLITLKLGIKNAFSQIDVQLKRRADLIPNLVEAVKGYMKHERGVLTEITKARTAMMNAKSMGDKIAKSNQLAGALKTLFAVAENYPQLKANENFLQLQEELTGTENKIAYSRQFYNDSVTAYNISIKRFPTNIFANLMHFTEEHLLATTTEERKAVKVRFE